MACDKEMKPDLRSGQLKPAERKFLKSCKISNRLPEQSPCTWTFCHTLLEQTFTAIHDHLYEWFHSTVTGFQSCSSRSPSRSCTHADKVKQQLQELCPLHSNQHKQLYELCPSQLDQHKKAKKEFCKKCLRGEQKSPEGIRTTTCIRPVDILATSNYMHQLPNPLCTQHYLSQLNKVSDYPTVTLLYQ